jgi:hypothetical protein
LSDLSPVIHLASHLFLAGFLFALFVGPEDEDDVFLQNVRVFFQPQQRYIS